jgi:hypothetical protein
MVNRRSEWLKKTFLEIVEIQMKRSIEIELDCQVVSAVHSRESLKSQTRGG